MTPLDPSAPAPVDINVRPVSPGYGKAAMPRTVPTEFATAWAVGPPESMTSFVAGAPGMTRWNLAPSAAATPL